MSCRAGLLAGSALLLALFTQPRRSYVPAKFASCGGLSLRLRPVLVWRPEVGELGEEVVVWAHLVLRHPPFRQDGDQAIAHIVGEQTTVVRVGDLSRRVVGQDIRLQIPQYRRTPKLRFRVMLTADGTEGWNWPEPDLRL